MSKFKGFVYGGPVPGSAGFYFGQGGGGPGICSGDSPALVHVNFVNSRFYTRTSGQVGITSNAFADLLTFTGAPGREYIDANGDTVVVGLNEPRIGSYIDIGSGLFDAGIRFNSGNGEAMKFNGAALARAIGSPGPELWDDGAATTSGEATYLGDGRYRILSTSGDSSFAIVPGALAPFQGDVVLVEYTVESTTGTGVLAQTAVLNNGAVRSSPGRYSELLVASIDGIIIKRLGVTDTVVSDISVRKVTMPAAVSIAIEGYMTYADLDAFNTVTHFSWETGDGTGVISYGLSTNGSDTGSMFFTHMFDSVFYNSKGPDDKSPGTNVPFSYSSAHTSSRCRGASDGVLGSDRVTLGIPDLIASDFEIAPTFNGNITSLTIWADDITDPGIQAATTDGSGFNPLCPFDG